MRIYLHLFNYILENAKAATRGVYEKTVFKIFAIFTGKHLSWILFNLGSCKIFKNTYLEEHLRTAASDNVFMTLRKMKYC